MPSSAKSFGQKTFRNFFFPCFIFCKIYKKWNRLNFSKKSKLSALTSRLPLFGFLGILKSKIVKLPKNKYMLELLE